MQSREVPIEFEAAALLIIDVQVFGARRDGGEFAQLSPEALEARCGYYFKSLETVVLPNMRRLQPHRREFS